MGIFSTKKTPLEIFTDGSHDKLGDSDHRGFGAYCKINGDEYFLSGTTDIKKVRDFYLKKGEIVEISNPTMEFIAVTKTLEYFINSDEDILLILDYNGIEKWVNGEWKAKKIYINDLLVKCKKQISQIEDNGGSVNFKWVKGHSGVYGNDQADKYARLGTNSTNFDKIFK